MSLTVLCGLASHTFAQGPTLRVPSQHATIQAAIQSAPSPATIEVASGTYHEVIDFLGKDLQVLATAGPSTTVLDGTGLNDACVTADSGEPLTARIAGFTLTHGAGKPIPSSYGFDYYGGGVYVGGTASNLRIENCRVLDNATATGTFGGGVCVAGGQTRAEVRRCVIAGNHAWASGGATLVTGTGSTMLLEHCTIVGNTANSWAFGHQGGVSMANGGGVTLRDCIVWGNGGYQIRAFGAPYNAGTSAVATFTCVQGGFSGLGNHQQDPLFVDPVARNYLLQSQSPCINAGDPTGPLDPDGSRSDMGCFPLNTGQAATFSTFGTGCAGAFGIPTLAAANGSRPTIGTTFQMQLANLPPSPFNVVFGLVGYSNSSTAGVPLPRSLSVYGLPAACTQYIDPFSGLTQQIVNRGGQADWGLPIPNAPYLQGFPIYLQGFVFDWQLTSPVPAIVTNAGEAVLQY